eukprot:CAMPEP_0119054856 /NCGR_PEP_ID=MMETSP1177-20130426/75356_1 /TAXON_ID=2985 /ORGANISM="Ochromonas sp, Strain CCMP1899" /LENGTH=429 /DNA_ID=CAMNT_0007035251 /DNA_START=470 /DNA_END=1759 /DNA_ORIENTATION=+
MSDMTKWIRALEYQADVVRGGCGMTIISEKNCSSSSPQGKGRGIKEKYRPPTLEANLEATMLRLERLESDLKGPRMQENNRGSTKENNRGSNKNNRDRRNSYDSDRENRHNERKSESTSEYLRPEDVSLYEKRERIREKMENKSSPKNKRSEEKYPDDDLDVVSGQRWKGDSPKHTNRNHGNRSDSRNNSGYDRNGYDRDHIRKKSYLHESDEDETDNKHRSRPEPLGQQGSSSSSNFSQGRGSEGRNKDQYGDDSLEEIPMHSKKTQRIRSQVQGHRDRDRNDDKDSRNGKGKIPPLGHSSWGYDDDIYGTKKEGSFEGNVSSRENQALHIAAGKAVGKGSLRSDSGGSGTNSYRSHRSVDHDDGPHFNDLPEMDMTVRMVPQRAARERRQERKSRAGTVDSSQEGLSTLGIGEMDRPRCNSGNSGWV